MTQKDLEGDKFQAPSYGDMFAADGSASCYATNNPVNYFA